jgi:hypothetical protein
MVLALIADLGALSLVAVLDCLVGLGALGLGGLLLLLD